MTEQQILDNMIVYLYDESSRDIDNDVKSKIWTHVVSHFDGMLVYDEIFSMNSIRDAQIFYEERNGASWATYYKEDPTYKPKIIGTGGYSYETTVENIASSVIVHEWYSHGKSIIVISINRIVWPIKMSSILKDYGIKQLTNTKNLIYNSC